MARWKEPTYNQKRQQKMKIKHMMDRDRKASELLTTARRGVRPSMVITDEINKNKVIATDVVLEEREDGIHMTGTLTEFGREVMDGFRD